MQFKTLKRRRNHHCRRAWPTTAAWVMVGLIVFPNHALGQTPVVDLKKLSIDQLSDIEITSVSRSEERLAETAAALAVVTNEDIRRSGATSIPEALRLVPGIHVAQQTSSSWAIGSRGFTSINSEKLLVLSDTRSIYTPLLSGVLWDVQDYLLQDVDRIEVIRGPGGTLWGANAVNGVINITTKSPKDTQGLYVETNAGTEERAGGAARYGGRAGDRAYYRIFAKYTDRAATLIPSGASPDDWQIGHVGGRMDVEAGTSDTFTVQGDLYTGRIGQIVPSFSVAGQQGPAGPLRADVAGGNVLARWRRTGNGSDVEVRAYYDRTHRNDPTFLDDLHTFDVDLLQRKVMAGHRLTWGANYRVTSNQNTGKVIFALNPQNSVDTLVSGFVQGEFHVLDSLRLTAGTKVGHNDFSGLEVEPSGRLAWSPSRTQTIWGAVSRAVRVPTRLERDIAIDVSHVGANPFVRLLGNSDFTSERLLAYEAGFRWQALSTLSVDLAAFDNHYRGLASLEFAAPFADGTRTVLPIENQNLTGGRTRGVETLVTVTPTPWWRLSASSSYLGMNLEPGGQDLNRGRFLDGATPRHQLGVRSYVDLPADFQLDAMFRDLTALRRLPAIVSGAGLPGYAELDLRLGWHGSQRLEIAVVGQNLLHPSHVEFGAPGARGAIERSVYTRIAWGF